MEGDRGENNYFAEYGLLIHELSEKLFKEELFEWDIKGELEKGLKSFKYKPPFHNMGVSYVKKIKEFFLDGDFSDQFAKYKVLEVEKQHSFEVNGNKFTGFVDLLCEHDDYGLTIADIKSAKVYEDEKLENNIQQMYLYSIAIKEKYGRYPDTLLFVYPREPTGKREYAYKFDLDKLETTKKFVTDIIEKIVIHSDWKARCLEVDGKVDFFACNLCNHRNNCDFRNGKKKVVGENPFNEDDDYDPFKD